VSRYLQWSSPEGSQQGVERSFGVASVVERAAAVGAAVGKEGVELALEPDRLVEATLDVVGVGVGGAVEHGGAHGVGEHGHPHGAEFAAVRKAEVRDLVLAER